MFVLRWLSRLPFPVLYTISDFLFFIGYYLIGYRNALVRRNLRNSFPDKSEAEIKRIQKDFYHNLCDYAVETIKLLSITPEELKRRLVYKNPEIVKQFSDKNQSILLLTSHQFNWEWLLASGCLYLPLGVDFVYQAQSNKTFNEFSLLGRTRFGAFPIERSQVGREAIKRKDVLRGIAVIADQFPGHFHNKKYWTQFLNQKTAFFLGLGQLAFLTQYPAVFFGVKKIKRGYYEAEGFVVSQPPYERESQQIVEDYIQATERIIKQQPAGWLWSHNRWKTQMESD
jgi:Kdo2-lipid IVA lauroyltransferase/acyltransferase